MKVVSGRSPIEDLWRRTLSRITTVYGRLVYLSSLRDPNDGRYRHHGLSLVFSERDADLALRESHQMCFQEWLAMRLEQQKADLTRYFETLPTDRQTLVENWLRLSPFQNQIPAAARRSERELFILDVESLLKVLKNERPASIPSQYD